MAIEIRGNVVMSGKKSVSGRYRYVDNEACGFVKDTVTGRNMIHANHDYGREWLFRAVGLMNKEGWRPLGGVSRSFKNELGNAIEIRIRSESIGVHPGVNIQMEGPDSTMENLITVREAVELRKLLKIFLDTVDGEGGV